MKTYKEYCLEQELINEETKKQFIDYMKDAKDKIIKPKSK